MSSLKLSNCYVVLTAMVAVYFLIKFLLSGDLDHFIIGVVSTFWCRWEINH